MHQHLLVSWERDSDFSRLVAGRIAWRTRSWRDLDDPLEPLSEVWAGLQGVFKEGHLLDGRKIGLVLTITDRRVINYFRSQGVRRREQPGGSHFDISRPETSEFSDPRLEEQIDKFEQREEIEAMLSETSPWRAAAVRSQFGLSGAPDWAEFVKGSGTTRQNLAKHARNGLRDIKLKFD